MQPYKPIISGVLAFWTLASFHSDARGYRAIPDDNLSYPVLITIKEHSLASGFYLSSGQHLYLVTSRHVLFTESNGSYTLKGANATCLSYSKDPNDPGKIKLELDLHRLNAKSLIRYHKDHDATIVRIANLRPREGGKGYRVDFVEGVEKVKYTKSGILGLAIENTRTFKQALISNDVFLFGYPTSIGVKETAQIDPNIPLLRKGIIAGKDKAKRTIIIDCPTYYGNSGGPVLQVERVSLTETKFSIIGLVSEFVPFKETWINATHKFSYWEISNSGYTIVTPIDGVLDLLEDTEKDDRQLEEPGK